MQSKKGKALSWIIFVVLIVGAFFVLWLWQRRIQPQGPSEAGQGQATTSTSQPSMPSKGFAKPVLSEKKKAELDNTAMANAMRGAGSCEDIQYDATLKQNCLDTMAYNSALGAGDLKLCDGIKDDSMRADCQDKITLTQATKNMDLALCDKITSAALRQDCKDRIQSFMGRTATSAKDCDGIQDAVLKQDCLDNFNFNTSVQNLSDQGCDSIQNADLKSRCSKTISKNKEVVQLAQTEMADKYQSTEQKLAGCDTLSGQEAQDCKNKANYSLAAEKKDISYCGQVKDSQLQQSCYQTQGAAIDAYYVRLALAKHDSSVCAKILDDTTRTTCQANVK
jgi:hypothetical protein